jgi:hypothetical protein
MKSGRGARQRSTGAVGLGLLVETFIVCYLGLLLFLVAYVGFCALRRHIADRQRSTKSQTDRDGWDDDFID